MGFIDKQKNQSLYLPYNPEMMKIAERIKNATSPKSTANDKGKDSPTIKQFKKNNG